MPRMDDGPTDGPPGKSIKAAWVHLSDSEGLLLDGVAKRRSGGRWSKEDVDSRGRVRVERKEEMRRRGLPSPDRADAVAMAVLQHEAVVDLAAHGRGGTLTGDILGMEW